MLRTACLFVIPLVLSGPALADQPDRPPPSITVDGEAHASSVPDTVTISFGVVTERPRAADAMAENSRAVRAVVEAIKAEGIEGRDVQTTAVDLSTVMDQPAHGAPKVVRFRASNELSITTKPVERAGALLGRLVEKGVNVVDSVTFSNAAEEALHDDLRAGAVRDARHKADLYVGAIGLKLGRVLQIVPGGGGDYAPRVYRKVALAAEVAAAPPVPLEPGARTISETASVTWELVQ